MNELIDGGKTVYKKYFRIILKNSKISKAILIIKLEP